MDHDIRPRLDLLATGRPGRLGTPLDAAIGDFARVVVRQRALDSLVTEVVRLRCARVHDCRLCQSVRLGEAAQAGFDEEIGAAIDRYESSDLDERLKVALRLTDAMIFAPVQVSAELREQVLAHFSPEEVVEMVFDIMKWSSQKSLVALRMEAPASADANVLSFDEHGDHRIGAC